MGLFVVKSGVYDLVPVSVGYFPRGEFCSNKIVSHFKIFLSFPYVVPGRCVKISIFILKNSLGSSKILDVVISIKF